MRLDFSWCGGEIASAEATKGHENRRMSAVALWKPSAPPLLGFHVSWLVPEHPIRTVGSPDKHADTVCKCAQLNREKGVERVEDPSQVQGRALPESRGRASGLFTPSTLLQSARKRPSVYPSRSAARCACRSSCRCRKSAGRSGNRTCPRRIRLSAAACRRGSRRRRP